MRQKPRSTRNAKTKADEPNDFATDKVVTAARATCNGNMTAPVTKTQEPVAIRMQQYTQFAALVVVSAGCYLVLSPFIPAILFAAVICSASWPLFVWMRQKLWRNSTIAALAMSLLLAVLVIGPSLLLAASLNERALTLAETIKAMLARGPVAPPDWLANVPLIGEFATQYWRSLAASGDSLATQSKGLLEPTRNFLVNTSKAIGEGLLQLVMASFIGFFFYRDGELLMASMRKALHRLAGDIAVDLLSTIQNTVTGVVHGVFGTALAQAVVATIGFLIAGVPAAILLGLLTFILSLVPIGPPLIWGGATIWLLLQEESGMAIFMFLWGLLFISTIDNVVKPFLISRSSNLPLLLTVVGVLGGVIAFGFIGVFIGPPVLAVGFTLTQRWIDHAADSGKKPSPVPKD